MFFWFFTLPSRIARAKSSLTNDPEGRDISPAVDNAFRPNSFARLSRKPSLPPSAR
jgi:hypothetical protein